MLYLQNKEDGLTYDFFVVDAHHHIGSDVTGYESNPIGPNGSYSFCKKVLNGDRTLPGIVDQLRTREKELLWKPVEYDGQQTAEKAVRFHPVMRLFSDHDSSLSKTYGFEDTLAIDQLVVFPMHDKYRMNEGVEYRASNNHILKWCSTYPHSLRLIGFGRVNPSKQLAIEELERASQRGIRGLKLHPTSEDFLIRSEFIKNTLRKAALLGLPVIFHTTYSDEVRNLYEMVNEIIQEFIKDGKTEFIPRLKVIAGHCTYKSSDTFLALSHPCIYGELSTLSAPLEHLKLARSEISVNKFIDITLGELGCTLEDMNKIFGYELKYLKWSYKLMFGSDHPFMPAGKVIELFNALLSYSSGLTPMDLQNILGANILRIVPPNIQASSAMLQLPKKHAEFVKKIIEKRNILSLDPLLDNFPVSRVRLHDNIVTFMEDGKRPTSVLLSSATLKSAASNDVESFESIRALHENEPSISLLMALGREIQKDKNLIKFKFPSPLKRRK